MIGPSLTVNRSFTKKCVSSVLAINGIKYARNITGNSEILGNVSCRIWGLAFYGHLSPFDDATQSFVSRMGNATSFFGQLMIGNKWAYLNLSTSILNCVMQIERFLLGANNMKPYIPPVNRELNQIVEYL